MRRIAITTAIASVLFFGASTGLLAEAKAPKNATFQCKDGSYSSAKTERGACSGHGGVKQVVERAPAKAAKAPAKAPAETPRTARATGKPTAVNAPADATGKCSD